MWWWEGERLTRKGLHLYLSRCIGSHVLVAINMSPTRSFHNAEKQRLHDPGELRQHRSTARNLAKAARTCSSIADMTAEQSERLYRGDLTLEPLEQCCLFGLKRQGH